ncbi:Hcp family type VI secretion system effector [Enterobacter asburiae]|uniref:Hcp family type VI secretion system effector n=1 Tax=Enterobacter asburiae TaxID=61645 RepID=UPI003F5792E9
MSNPAYLFLIDNNGTPMVGDCLIPSRLGAIELRRFTHNIFLPVDGVTGKLTSTRVHNAISMQKEYDRLSPMLYRALCECETLKLATIKMYSAIDSGMEEEYFNIILENVKIVSITPDSFPDSGYGTHLENIQVRYESITWKHCAGNIIYKDSWNSRVVA